VRGLVVEIKKMVPHSYKGGKMVALSEVLDRICTPDHFRVYDYSPPDMIEACRSFISDYEQELEELELLIDSPPKSGKLDDVQLRQKMCLRPKICHKIWPQDKYPLDPVTGQTLPPTPPETPASPSPPKTKQPKKESKVKKDTSPSPPSPVSNEL